MTPATKTVLEALRTSHEGSESHDADDQVWADVYLDNAKPAGMSGHSWAGHLAALKAEGFYKQLDGIAFGEVRLTD